MSGHPSSTDGRLSGKDGALSRRQLLAGAGVGAVGLAAAGTLGFPMRAVGETFGFRKKVVIIGGGLAGLSLAWLLDGEYDVVVLEAEKYLGGHMFTVDAPLADGTSVAMDVGAQFISPRKYPTYWALINEILRIPTKPVTLDTTFTTYGESHPLLVSPSLFHRPAPFFHTRYWEAFLALNTLVTKAEELDQSDDWDSTIEEFVGRLSVPAELKQSLIYPVFSAMCGWPIERMKGFSARTLSLFIAQPLFASVDFHNAVGGLRSIADALKDNCRTASYLTSSPVKYLKPVGCGYQVFAGNNESLDADHVVFALSPERAAPLVKELPAGDHLNRVLLQFPYYDSRLIIHTDPAFMPAKRKNWSACNSIVDGGTCETSMWYGGLHQNDVSLFKSWCNYRRTEPKEIVAERVFRHGLTTPETVRGLKGLNELQGDLNRWFVGSYTGAVDSQESALLSAVRVAKRLAPRAHNLHRLTAVV